MGVLARPLLRGIDRNPYRVCMRSQSSQRGVKMVATPLQISTDHSRFGAKRLGDAPYIHPTADVRDCTLGRYVEVGERSVLIETSFDDYSYVVNDAEIAYTQVGKFVNIAAHTRINPGQHPMWRASLHHFMYRSSWYGMGPDETGFFDWRRSMPVRVGHDTWIGHGVVIMGKVTIGNGAIVGSNAVITHDVAPYTIVAGVPGQPLRERFPIAIQQALERIAWWDWSHEQLTNALGDFRSLDAEGFCRKYDPA